MADAGSRIRLLFILNLDWHQVAWNRGDGRVRLFGIRWVLVRVLVAELRGAAETNHAAHSTHHPRSQHTQNDQAGENG